ncbi:hypothetical protein M8J77_016140 [Diaphorina citri]|nr:hypothetical protein M8J77_016140 [Diaphorina citri]
MNDKKDRNQKRMRDKYKSKKPAAQLKQKTVETRAAIEKEKAKVPNNWDRYEEIVDEHEDSRVEATNFATLSSNVNEKNFFQFKHEKKWLEEMKQSSSSDQVPTDAFHLNLNLLKAAIGTCPIPLLCDIPTDLFTDSAVYVMDGQWHQTLDHLCGKPTSYHWVTT